MQIHVRFGKCDLNSKDQGFLQKRTCKKIEWDFHDDACIYIYMCILDFMRFAGLTTDQKQAEISHVDCGTLQK